MGRGISDEIRLRGLEEGAARDQAQRGAAGEGAHQAVWARPQITGEVMGSPRWNRYAPVSRKPTLERRGSNYEGFREDWRRRPQIGDPQVVNDPPGQVRGESLSHKAPLPLQYPRRRPQNG